MSRWEHFYLSKILNAIIDSASGDSSLAHHFK
jgi:hypothetical protein